ncbi:MULTISPECIES: polyprenyl synthetase family protein [Prevotella]|jgi:geranylgeranyl diphosphate synthase, type II|uniref:polyprenyl synthetase family protein n=1 Tax=Prevotella TaxID=838 RepID=UPI00033B3555|nr:MULTISPECIES: polyprenyl synthetase family protein [Prevotella]KIP58761.1 isoprenyl synthetase [Prevotella pectinovora]KIP61401.1 isoprenyl synthetase [Prevotella pectinovora]MCI6047031.1 polyprenyl synthetase family protein [Prevotella pectinovora]MDD7743208.1 polyprenyl synthetase family protein [Prevotella pectinovora]MEE1545821.1 polyprenyl synthetase family protein [Prevotella pectinovora]
MLTATEIQEKVNAYIASLPYERKPKSLYDPIEYVLAAGGKRIRPSFVLMAYNLFHDDVDRILPVATALETYHNYTLLHDDLMDKADMRRGRPTVHKKWDDNTAILSGDTMLVLAYEHLAKCDTKYLKPALDLFTETALEVSEGQQFDMEFETRNDVAEEEYIEMIRLKTSVLLACALKMGAVVAGASDADANALYAFGEKVGLAFQLQDDLLDVYGDPKVFGKAIGGDITSNKKTFMLINAFNRADAGTRAELERWTTATEFDPAEKIAAVTEIYNRLGIDKLAEQRIKEYFEQSRQHLDELSVSDDRKAVLREYTERMMNRKK